MLSHKDIYKLIKSNKIKGKKKNTDMLYHIYNNLELNENDKQTVIQFLLDELKQKGNLNSVNNEINSISNNLLSAVNKFKTEYKNKTDNDISIDVKQKYIIGTYDNPSNNKIYNEFNRVFGLKLYLPFGNDIILKEVCDVNKIGDILRNKTNEFDKHIYEYLRWIIIRMKNNKYVEQKYNYIDVYGIGRLFTTNKSSIQSLPKLIRNYIIKRYTDIDMVNSFYTILLWLSRKLKCNHKYILQYVNNRDTILNSLKSKYKLDRNEIKVLFIELGFGGIKTYNKLKHKDIFIENLLKELKNVRSKTNKLFPKLKSIIKKDKNIQLSLFSIIIQSIENHILMCMATFFKLYGTFDDGTLMFDGFLISKSNHKENLLRRCEKYINRELKIDTIKLSFKPIKPKLDIKGVPLLSNRSKPKSNIRLIQKFNMNKIKYPVLKNHKFTGSYTMTKKLMTEKYYRKFKYKIGFEQNMEKEEEYIDEWKPAKDVFTNLITYNFLSDNKYQIRLMKTMFHEINKVLDKNNSWLIFYGGNLMRLISKNMSKYFGNETDKLINSIYAKYVVKSDNDFVIMSSPYKSKNIDEYNKTYFDMVDRVIQKLEHIRNIIDDKKYHYFSFFNLKKKEQQRLIDKKKDILNDIYKKNKIQFKSAKIENRNDLLILSNSYTNNNDFKSTELYSSKNSSPLYNSYNDNLEFFRFGGNKIHSFNLLRTKINFRLTDNKNNKINVGGELIDIGIPKIRTDHNWYHMTDKDMNNFIKKYTKVLYDEEYGFKYRVYNLEYQVLLLLKVIYTGLMFPWLDDKYEKRIARIFYFDMFYELSLSKTLNTKSINKLIIKVKNNKTKYLNMIKDNETKFKFRNQKDRNNYKQYLKIYDKYKTITIDILNSLKKFLSGNEQININDVFKINIG
jgi:hypothetical protein